MRGIESDLVLVWGLNLTRILCRGRNLLHLGVRAESYLVLIRIWIKIDLVLLCGWKMICVLCGDRMNWSLCGGRNWFGLYAGQKWRRFIVDNEIELVFVWVVEIKSVLVWGVELDLILVEGWNWFGWCVGDRSWFDFSVGIGIDLIFVWRSKMTWF